MKNIKISNSKLHGEARKSQFIKNLITGLKNNKKGKQQKLRRVRKQIDRMYILNDNQSNHLKLQAFKKVLKTKLNLTLQVLEIEKKISKLELEYQQILIKEKKRLIQKNYSNEIYQAKNKFEKQIKNLIKKNHESVYGKNTS